MNHTPDMDDVRRFVAREIEQAISTERHRITTALRSALSTLPLEARAVVEVVVGAVEGE